jgi:hypothetical protein
MCLCHYATAHPTTHLVSAILVADAPASQVCALHWDSTPGSRNLVSASQDGKIIVWNALSENKVLPRFCFVVVVLPLVLRAVFERYSDTHSPLVIPSMHACHTLLPPPSMLFQTLLNSISKLNTSLPIQNHPKVAHNLALNPLILLLYLFLLYTLIPTHPRRWPRSHSSRAG